jgi:hypothetical protein
MTTFAYTVKRHEPPEIIVYFYTNATNVCTKSLNAKIQRLFLISS